jgi:hypothetical protein
MRRLSVYLMVLVLFIAAGCRKDKTEPEIVINFIPETTENIGSDGGEIEIDNFVLTIPEDAFSTDNEIQLLSAEDGYSFGENIVSKMYKIEGLPFDYKKPLKIKIKYTGTLSGESYLAVGETVLASSVNEVITAYHLTEVTDSSGWLIGQIPVPEENTTPLSKSEKTISGDETDYTGFILGCITSYASLYSANENFFITYPMFMVSYADAEALAGYLEEAYQKYQTQYDFDYSNRTNWPVAVNIKPFPKNAGAFGYYINSYLGNNAGWIEFNYAKMSDRNEMRITAGHEFFHLVQSLYDNRNRASKACCPSDHHWFSEATAAYMECKFTDDANYQTKIVEGLQLAPFDGLHAGGQTAPIEHGYGSLALINYLTGKYGEGFIKSVYESVYAGTNVIDAISKYTEEPVNWLEDFFRQYILTNLDIYGVNGVWWGQSSEERYTIGNINDIGYQFRFNYPDLSARLYRIDFKDASLDDDDKIVLSLDGGVSEITVFSLLKDNIQFLTNSYNSVTIEKIKQNFQDKKTSLLILVVNNKAVKPYTGKEFIDLNLSVVRNQVSPEWNACGVQVNVMGHYYEFTSETSREYDSDGAIYNWKAYPGSFTENTFTGNYYETFTAYDNTLTISGEVTLVLNPQHNLIETLTWTEEHESTDGFTRTESFTVKDIPEAWSEVFQIEGEDVCDHIESLSVNQVSDDGLNYSLQSWVCNGDSKIFISFYDQ